MKSDVRTTEIYLDEKQELELEAEMLAEMEGEYRGGGDRGGDALQKLQIFIRTMKTTRYFFEDFPSVNIEICIIAGIIGAWRAKKK